MLSILSIALLSVPSAFAVRRVPSDFTTSSIDGNLHDRRRLHDHLQHYGHRGLGEGRTNDNSAVEEDTDALQQKDLIQEVIVQNRVLASSDDTQTLPTPADHEVTSLPYLNPGTFKSKHYAGHLPASPDDDKKLFYWLFEPDFEPSDGSTRSKAKKNEDIPLLIWLNGGPGCK